MLLYSASGGLWSLPGRVTFSFVPDGTNVGGVPSALVSTLNASYSTSVWQQQFQKAAAVWEAVSNINLSQVSDNGADIGGAGNQQGDPNFGDIRIGGMPQSNSQLAFALSPPPFNGGSAAGDIFLNTTQNWSNTNGYDLETVAIHEFGHALGMSHSAITNADMYAYYNGTKQALTSDDTAGIQSVYGGRQNDAIDAAHSNNTSSTATDITSYIDANSQIALPSLDVTTTLDADWYKVTVPANTTGTLTASVQSTNLSELSPRINIFNSSLQSLAYQSLPNTYGATATASITGVTAGQTYYIRASNANNGITGTGGYGLLVNFGSAAQAPINPPNTTVAARPDQGGGSSGEGAGDSGLLGGPGIDIGQTIQIGKLIAWGDDLSVADMSPAHPGTSSPADASSPVDHTVYTLTFDQALAMLGSPTTDDLGKAHKKG